MPEFYLIGGPNGVGKSTFSDDTLSSFIIINGDRIAKEMKEAGLIVDDYNKKQAIDDQVRLAVTKHQSLVFESNLNVPSNYKLTEYLQQQSYTTSLFYPGIDSVSILNERIAERVKRGEHYVSPGTVAERYVSSLRLLPFYAFNFENFYLLDSTTIPIYPLLRMHNKHIQYLSDEMPSWAQPVINQLQNIIDNKNKIDKIRDNRYQ